MSKRLRKKKSKNRLANRKKSRTADSKLVTGSSSADWIYTVPSEFYAAFLFLVCGIALFLYTETNYTNHDPRLDRWRSVQAEVVGRSIVEKACYKKGMFKSQPFLLEVKYRYDVENKFYSGIWGPFCATSQQDAELKLRAKVQNSLMGVYYNPLLPSEHLIDPDGPWQLWLGRVFAILFFLLAVPRVIIVPAINLRNAWRSILQGTNIASVLISIFPIRYQAIFQKAVEVGYSKTPIPFPQSRSPKIEIIHDQPYRPKMHAREYNKKGALFDILWSFDSNPPRQRVSFFISTDRDFELLMKSKWQNDFSLAVSEALKQKSLSLSRLPVAIYVHSEEEIRRVGPRDYWY